MQLIKVIVESNKSEFPEIDERLNNGYEIVGMNFMGMHAEVYMTGGVAVQENVAESETEPVLTNPFDEPEDEETTDIPPEETEVTDPTYTPEENEPLETESEPVEGNPDSLEALQDDNPDAPTDASDSSGPAPAEPDLPEQPALVGETDETIPEVAQDTASPYDGPHADLLADNGLTSRQQVMDATDDELIAISGIAEARLAEIRDYLSLT